VLTVRFWGTRGSIPVALTAAALRRKLTAVLGRAHGRLLDTPERIDAFLDHDVEFAVSHTFGGSTACVELDGGSGEYVLCDLGSGARAFGQRVLAAGGAGARSTVHVFMSHLHWDHIMGFPFLVQAYQPGHRIRIHGCHPEMEAAFRRQHGPPSFPVGFERLEATIEFVQLEPGRAYEIGGFRVTPKRQRHSGDSYGYRFERDGRVVVYSTDSEHKRDDPAETEEFVAFFRDADLVVFDAMYSLADAISVKEDWGHSSNVVGVELAQLARVKHLCLFHHEPASDDEVLARVWAETRRFEALTRGDHVVRISAAYDGMEIVL
jgi:phosphoribosyl 1,2-cyclic phosphodiesterase